MELLKYINNELRVKSFNDVINDVNRRTMFYSIDYIRNAPDYMKVVGNVIMARDPVLNRQTLYVYNGYEFAIVSTN